MDRLLTPEQIAEYIGVKKSTIYQWTHIGYIPDIKIGRFVRFKENDVIKWLETKSINGRSRKPIDIPL